MIYGIYDGFMMGLMWFYGDSMVKKNVGLLRRNMWGCNGY